MKNSMIINAPNLPKPTSTSNFVFSIVLIILIGIGSLSILFFPAGIVPVYMNILSAIFGGSFVLIPFYAVMLRIDSPVLTHL